MNKDIQISVYLCSSLVEFLIFEMFLKILHP